MVQQAEQFAEADKKQREAVDVRNQVCLYGMGYLYMMSHCSLCYIRLTGGCTTCSRGAYSVWSIDLDAIDQSSCFTEMHACCPP